ncbi:Phenylalanine--tRNA ligase beta subunit [Dirofilaria immitis]
MFPLRCCRLCDESVEMIRAPENQSQVLDEPVIIEPLPEVTTLQLAQPSESLVKPASPSAFPLSPVPTPTNWKVFKEISSAKNFDSTSSFVVPAERGNASDEQVDMHSALDKRITSREYILSITDDELCRFPIAFIESFYSHLSPGEIMQLEQRLCDLKTGISSTEQGPEPLSVESENFLKSYRPQITIYTDAGFQIGELLNSYNLFYQSSSFRIWPKKWVFTRLCKSENLVHYYLIPQIAEDLYYAYRELWFLSAVDHFGSLGSYIYGMITDMA